MVIHGLQGDSLGDTREELIEAAGLESTLFTKATRNPRVQKTMEGAALYA
jgi:hypothetical protein